MISLSFFLSFLEISLSFKPFSHKINRKLRNNLKIHSQLATARSGQVFTHLGLSCCGSQTPDPDLFMFTEKCLWLSLCVYSYTCSTQWVMSSDQIWGNVTLTRYTAEQNQEAVRVSQGVREGNDRGHECVRGRGLGQPWPCELWAVSCTVPHCRVMFIGCSAVEWGLILINEKKILFFGNLYYFILPSVTV